MKKLLAFAFILIPSLSFASIGGGSGGSASGGSSPFTITGSSTPAIQTSADQLKIQVAGGDFAVCPTSVTLNGANVGGSGTFDPTSSYNFSGSQIFTGSMTFLSTVTVTNNGFSSGIAPIFSISTSIVSNNNKNYTLWSSSEGAIFITTGTQLRGYRGGFTGSAAANKPLVNIDQGNSGRVGMLIHGDTSNGVIQAFVLKNEDTGTGSGARVRQSFVRGNSTEYAYFEGRGDSVLRYEAATAHHLFTTGGNNRMFVRNSSVTIVDGLSVEGGSISVRGYAGGFVGVVVGTTSKPASTFKDYAIFYSSSNITDGVTEMYVKDSAGNETKISPHNKEGNWVYSSINTKKEKSVYIDMENFVADLEKVTGRKYIFESEDQSKAYWRKKSK